MRILFCSLALVCSAQALQLRNYSAVDHDRFLNFPSNPSFNPNFLYGNLDLTGIGWYPADTRRQFALVSPIHFVGARHFWPSTSQSLRFLAADGTIHTIPILSRETIPNSLGQDSDLFLGTLENRVPDGVAISPLPYLNLSSFRNYRAYRNLELITFGKDARAGQGLLDTISDVEVEDDQGNIVINETKVLSFEYNDPDIFGDDDDAHAESGDSGSPTLTNFNGQPALLGTHMAVGELELGGVTTYTTFDSFVPHYISELNALMEGEGYHMKEAVPASTSLGLTVTPPALLRAGQEAVFDFSLANTGSNDANNLRLDVDAGELAGLDWVDNGAGSVRKAGLDPAVAATGQWTVAPANSGTWQATFTVNADELSTFPQVESFNVLPSFWEWALGLGDATEFGDDDGDSIVNLLEYALGGDATVTSRFFPGTTESLMPVIELTSSGIEITHPVRTDAVERALTYEIECSPDLTPESWQSLVGEEIDSSSINLNGDFVLQTLTYDQVELSEYYRLKVTLDE